MDQLIDDACEAEELYGVNALERFATSKPEIREEDFCRDGNIFAVAGAVQRAYRRAGRGAEWMPIMQRVMESGSYNAALAILQSAVEII